MKKTARQNPGQQPSGLLARIRNVTTNRDLLIALAFTALCYLFAIAFNLADRLVDLNRAFNSGEAFAISLLLLALIVYLAIFIYRRSRELSQVQEELETVARHWQSVFNAVGDGIALIDGEGKIIRHNHAMSSLVRDEADDLVGYRRRGIVRATSASHSGCGCPSGCRHRIRACRHARLR